MGSDVNGHEPRTYDGSGRRRAALARRRLVLQATRQLLEDRGYLATTIGDVADASGVSPETIYKSFGTKAGLVKAVFDVVIGGDDEPVTVAERPEIARIRDEPDVRLKLRLYAEGASVRAERSSGLQLALRNASIVDPAIGSLWESIQEERLAGATGFAQHLVETGRLREGISVEEVRDVLWTAISVEVFDLLVIQRQWSREAYADWLERTLVASIAREP